MRLVFCEQKKKMDPRAVNFNSKQIHKFRCFNVAWSADTNGWFGKQINALFVVLRFQSKVNIDTFARKRLFFLAIKRQKWSANETTNGMAKRLGQLKDKGQIIQNNFLLKIFLKYNSKTTETNQNYSRILSHRRVYKTKKIGIDLPLGSRLVNEMLQRHCEVLCRHTKCYLASLFSSTLCLCTFYCFAFGSHVYDANIFSDVTLPATLSHTAWWSYWKSPFSK